MEKYLIFLTTALLLCFFVADASALTITSVDSPDIFPGDEATISVSVHNILNQDIEDVSFSLNFQNIPISSVGSSEDLIKKLTLDDSDVFQIKIRSAPNAAPGDYKIPYLLSYRGATNPRTGTINVRVKGNVDLSTTLSTEKPVMNSEDKLTLKIINKGFSDARYVLVKIVPLGLSLHSEDTIYIGDIRSNDFETAVFNVKYSSPKPSIEALIEYLDFNNDKKTLIIQSDIKLYTQEEAIREGIIQKNNTFLYISIIIILLIIFFVWRVVKKIIRKRKSLEKIDSDLNDSPNKPALYQRERKTKNKNFVFLIC